MPTLQIATCHDKIEDTNSHGPRHPTQLLVDTTIFFIAPEFDSRWRQSSMPLSTMKSLIASAAPSYTSCSTTVTGKNHVMDAATALAQLCQWGNGGAVDDSPSLSTMTLSPPPTTTTAEGKTLAPFEEENPLENEKYEKQEDDTFIINQNCSSSHKTTTAKHCNSGNNNTNEKWIFPQRLMTILNDTNRLETIHVISWLPHGKSFMILKPEKLMRDVLPLFFPPRASSSFALDEAKGDRSTNSKTALTASLPKYVSFTRKLHRWYVLVLVLW